MSSQEEQNSQEPLEAKDIKLIYAANGEPFPTANGAKKSLKMKGLSDDEWEPVPITGTPTPEDPYGERIEGYVLRRIKPKEYITESEYYRVRFTPKSNPADPDDVTLSVNGDTLVIQRDTETIIPARYKECADHAVYPTFRQLPDQPRKIVSQIQYFPYQLLGPATEKDYLKLKSEGTKKTAQMVRQYGFHYDPDKAE